MRPGVLLLLLAIVLGACTPPAPAWERVLQREPAGLLSVWGTSATDVWAVGADPGDGAGPYVLHFDGATWTRLRTGATGDLWWVHGLPGGPVWFAGENGLVLRWDAGAFTRLEGPATTDTLFGLWGASADDLWAVGGGDVGRPVVWRAQSGGPFVQAPDFPADSGGGLFKVWGRSATDVWFAGGEGALVRWSGAAFERVASGTAASLLTVHGSAARVVAVGGALGAAVVVDVPAGGAPTLAATDAPSLSGVFVADDAAWAVGDNGTVLRRDASGWHEESTGFEGPETLHGVWRDPDGGLWVVGGRIAASPRVSGLILHRGRPVGPGSVILP